MSMAMKYAVQKRNRRMAEGGDVSPAHPGSSMSAHQRTYDAKTQSENEARLKTPEGDAERMAGNAKRLGMAEGGEACQACRGGTCMAHGGDVVDRVIKRMSEGGMIANGGDTNDADQEPAQFDDLALRDDLESSYTGANSGDMDGAPEGLSDDEQMIERIMKRLRG